MLNSLTYCLNSNSNKDLELSLNSLTLHLLKISSLTYISWNRKPFSKSTMKVKNKLKKPRRNFMTGGTTLLMMLSTPRKPRTS